VTSAHAASEHGVHAVVVLAPVLYLLVVVLRERRRGAPRRAAAGHGLADVAVAGTGIAGLVHALVGLSHLPDGDVHAAFFLVAAVVQLALAVVVRAGRSVRPLLALAATDLALLGLWTTSRVSGLPTSGSPLPLGAADGLVAVCEVAAVAAVMVLLVRLRSSSGVGGCGPVQLEPHGLAAVGAEGPPAISQRLHDGKPAAGLGVVC
jgi:hypothetical protein